ncbi:hypothetical protein PI27_gp033 [Listeria phage WIL-1]|nr:hypothetical protein PI27_gp033 [Listeria phage WIL-1]
MSYQLLICAVLVFSICCVLPN